MSDYGGNNYNSHFLAGFDIPTSQNSCITVLVVLVTACSYPSPVEMSGLCTWQQSSGCILGIRKWCWSPYIVLMTKIPVSVVNTITALQLPLHCGKSGGGEWSPPVPAGHDTAHLQHWVLRAGVIVIAFDAQLLWTGEYLSSGPLGSVCSCTMLVTVPGHRPCEVPLGTSSCWDPNLLGTQVNH